MHRANVGAVSPALLSFHVYGTLMDSRGGSRDAVAAIREAA